jgi:hypothetical protein
MSERDPPLSRYIPILAEVRQGGDFYLFSLILRTTHEATGESLCDSYPTSDAFGSI